MNCGIGLNDPYLESLFYSGASWNPDSGVQGVSALAGSVVGSAQYAWQFSPASNQKFSPQALARSVGSKGVSENKNDDRVISILSYPWVDLVRSFHVDEVCTNEFYGYGIL